MLGTIGSSTSVTLISRAFGSDVSGRSKLVGVNMLFVEGRDVLRPCFARILSVASLLTAWNCVRISNNNALWRENAYLHHINDKIVQVKEVSESRYALRHHKATGCGAPAPPFNLDNKSRQAILDLLRASKSSIPFCSDAEYLHFHP